MITVATQAQVLQGMAGARSVLLTAYVLRPGATLDALRAAARRGAKVTVRLEGRPYGDADGQLLAGNRAAVKALRALGADASLVDRSGTGGPPLHMKALVCDGTAFLDDRNWPDNGADMILRDDFTADVRGVQAAALGGPAPPGRWFWTTKTAAIDGQAHMLYRSTDARHVDVESESFGVTKQTYAALKKLAQAGVHCRLLVAQRDVTPRSRHALDLLAAAGVAVRTGTFDEKMAVVDGTRAWAGSANATSNAKNGDQIDWGLRTDNAAVALALQTRFNANWSQSAPLKPEQTA